ncbi:MULTISPECIES: LysR substrate-binding domain-containing protein [Methylosinus]|uniref:LysR family transcriptional regulator n=1 Tax=Methylosinus trichosporium (strain ATCC 35070 / NCIMB 11131 / UNIQEM 75 / OB3b) TaxID=595536 RepID=A0A2D2D161_METT3|nr:MULTISPECIES: LysR substrate-binding domain-containing protein [Methylosinus]ATQ68722.1 LysR family transcriptional regulator [Methylosinus trichosporium OB3b]OBS53118.1 LysR family transcriptional regulator [Methylosinus sp. 3S-1]
MRHLPSLVALKAFEAAAWRQSFKLAAADLGVTPTAVSHQIKQLEAELGVSLFTRRPRGIAVTPEGRALFIDLRRAFDAIAEAVERTRERRRIAALAAPAALAERLLLPRIDDFRARCPGWDLRLRICDDADEPRDGATDVVIRCGPLEAQSRFAATPLPPQRFAPVCSPTLGVRRPRHLATATLLHCPSTPSWRQWLEARGKGRFDPESGLRFEDEAALIRAAVAGRGVALARLPLVARELRSEALAQPFGPHLDGPSYHLVHSHGAQDQPAVAVLRDWLLAELVDTPRGADQ